MRVLVVGNGAREHIVCEKISESAEVYTIMNKKNPGMARISKEYLITDYSDKEKMVEWASSKNIDLVFVSPDPLLAAGLSDLFENAGIKTASPSKAAARIEWDKEFARNLMKRKGIKGQVRAEIAHSEEESKRIIKEFGEVAVKPIGLTGGKGVKVSGDHFASEKEAIAYASEIIKKDGKVLIEEKIEGEEFSLQLFSDGKKVYAMPPVQDHKRAYENDEGPNTGGMGSYSTGKNLPFLKDRDIEEGSEISQKIVDALREIGAEYKGILYTQLMATKDGVKVIEFNSRFGDPEAMNVLVLLKDDLAETLSRISESNLSRVEFEEMATVVKYLVPKGYPINPKKDEPIKVNEEKIKENRAKLYYASVYEKDGGIFTTTSRALAIVGKSESIEEAEKIVEGSMKYIEGPLWHRKDIGKKELIEKRIRHMERLRG